MGKILSTYLMPHPPIIVPEVGRGKENTTIKTIKAMGKIGKEIKTINPDTIIVISPHGNLFKDAISILGEEKLKGNLGKFNAPNVSIEKTNNIELATEIDGKSWEEGISTVLLNKEVAKDYDLDFNLDHGAIVPLYFVEQEYKDYKLVHINYGLLSRVDLYKFGHIISKCIEESTENVVVIASGDLSHRLTPDAPSGYSENGKKFDIKLLRTLEKKDIKEIFNIDERLIAEAGECGLRSIDIMLGTLEGYKFDLEILSYEGPFGVGYGVVKVDNLEQDEDASRLNRILNIEDEKMKDIRTNESHYVKLARKTVENYAKKGMKPGKAGLIGGNGNNLKAGVFVSIKKDGELRGCIGTIEASKDNIIEEIINNAISASAKDPRFYPVDIDELDKLVYSVDILEKAEVIDDINQLNPNIYGVIVEKDSKRGLLLPKIDGISTAEEQIEIALGKAGIDKNEDYLIYRFKVIRYY